MGHELENIDLTVAQRKEIAALLKRHLPDTEVWAYGSRVKFTSKPSSDLDMVAFASSSQKVAVYDLKEAFEESDLPFRVDLFIWDEVPEQFHKNIEAERVVLQKVVEKRVVGSEWKSVPIGKCATVYSGFAFKSQDLGNEGVPVVKIKNVNNKVVDFSETQFFPQNLVTPRHDKFFLEDGDVLIAMTGQGSVGRVGRIRLGNNQKVLLNQRVGRFIVKSNLNIGYLYYVISSDYYEDILFNAGLGSGQPNLSPAVIAQIEIPLPPLLEQKAIAHILGSLDDKIELNRRMNATLEGMAQALFKSWFVDFDPVIDNALAAGNPIPEELAERAEARRKALADATANRETAKQFPATFQLTEKMGWIPEGWKAVSLNQAIQINPSVKLSKGTIAIFADMKSLPTDGYTIDNVIEKAYSGGAKFQNDDVLLARITPCLENGKTGIVDFLSRPRDVGIGSTEFIVLRGKGELKLSYVACLAREESFRLHCIQSMIGSSGRQRVQNACFDSFQIAYPADTFALKKFSEIAQPMFQKACEQAKESRILTKLRDTLLPKLISGEIRISDAEKLAEEAMI